MDSSVHDNMTAERLKTSAIAGSSLADRWVGVTRRLFPQGSHPKDSLLNGQLA